MAGLSLTDYFSDSLMTFVFLAGLNSQLRLPVSLASTLSHSCSLLIFSCQSHFLDHFYSLFSDVL